MFRNHRDGVEFKVKAPKVPAVPDIARIIKSTRSKTVEALVEYYESGGGIFNYSLSHRLAHHAYGHTVPLPHIVKACGSEWSVAGRTQNEEVLRRIWDAGASRSLRCFELESKIFAIRKDLQIRVSPPFYFIEKRRPVLFWLQPRRHYALDDTQLGLLVSIVKFSYLVGDLGSLDLELLDLSVPKGEDGRATRLLSSDSLPVTPTETAQELLQRFADAYDEVKARGIEVKQRPRKRRQPDPGLFDDQK